MSFELHDDRRVLDVAQLPDTMNGLHLHKAKSFEKTEENRKFNRPRMDITFAPVPGVETVWAINKEAQWLVL